MIVYGEVRAQTPIRERYVATQMVKRWQKQGNTAKDIALIWNQGHTGKCSAGTNSRGVKFDSCSYAQAVLAKI